jgi:hypothetical protein
VDFTDLVTLWTDAGGSAAWAPLFAGIALAESGGDPTAANTSDPYGGSFGLWQINGSHGPGGEASASWISQMEIPLANAQEAVALSSGGTNAQPWTDDRLWLQWQAAGAPAAPSAATVQGWITAAGVGGGSPGDLSGVSSALSTLTPAAATAPQPLPTPTSFVDFNPLQWLDGEGELKWLGGELGGAAGSVGGAVGGAVMSAIAPVFLEIWNDSKRFVITAGFVGLGLGLIGLGAWRLGEKELRAVTNNLPGQAPQTSSSAAGGAGPAAAPGFPPFEDLADVAPAAAEVAPLAAL